MRFILRLGCLLCLWQFAGRAAETPAKPRLTLPASMEVALEKNLGLGVRRVEESSAREDVEIARAIFEPEFFGSAGRNFRASEFENRDFFFSGFRAGVGAKLPTGATFDVSGDLGRSEVGFQPETFDSSVQATIRQPLLKGGGIHINRLPITVSLINVSQANGEIRRAVLDLMRNVESAWWDLVFAHRARDITERTLAVSERLVKEAEARGKVGLATELDTLQASTAVASRREAVITAGQIIDNRRDDLLLFLGSLGVEEYQIVLPAGIPPIRARHFSTEEALGLVRALPEYQVQINSIRERKLYVDKARNEGLPSLDITGGTGYRGFGRSEGEAFERGFDKRQDWQVLVEMRVPLGFRAERAQISRARNALEIERLRTIELEQLLHSQVREAERSVVAGIEKMKVTTASLELSEKQFDQLLARFKEGLTAFRDMELAQEDLQEARMRALASQLEAVKAAIRLARMDGTLLARYGMAWDVQK